MTDQPNEIRAPEMIGGPGAWWVRRLAPLVLAGQVTSLGSLLKCRLPSADNIDMTAWCDISRVISAFKQAIGHSSCTRFSLSSCETGGLAATPK